MALPARLEVVVGTQTRVVEIPISGLEIGRAPGLGLTIDSPAISKRHARLSWDGDDLILLDLGATNPVRRRGQPLSGPTLLGDGDELVLGDVLLRVFVEQSGFGYPITALGDDVALSATNAPAVPPGGPTLAERAAALLPVLETFFHATTLRDLGTRVVDAVATVFPISRVALIDLENGATRFRVLGLAGRTIVPSSPSFVSRTVVMEAVRRGIALHQLGAVGRGPVASLVEARTTSAVAVLLRCRGDRHRILYLDTTAEDLGVRPPLTWQHAYELQMFATYATSAMDGLAERDERKLEETRLEHLRRHLAPQAATNLVERGDDGAFSTPRMLRAVVLRADLVGFVALVARAGASPAAAMEVLDRWLDTATAAIFESGGTLEGFAGDTITAVFGVPDPIRDPVPTAVACGRALCLAAQDLAEATGQPLLATLGIELGEVLVGRAGSRRRREFMVLGPAAVVASRACAAVRGGVAVGPAAARELEGMVALEPLGDGLFLLP